jgi:hypothetical protein
METEAGAAAGAEMMINPASAAFGLIFLAVLMNIASEASGG